MTAKRFKSILLVTYGRSGSTLLQGVLNTLPSVVVRGENHDFCWGLYMAYKSLVIAKGKFGESDKNSTAAWYGAKDLSPDLFIEHARSLLKEQLCSGIDYTEAVWGFKEIRYLNHLEDLPAFLDFLSKLLPQPAIIFNTRDHISVCKSAFMQNAPEKEVRKKLALADRIFFEYAERNDHAFICRYERVILGAHGLNPLFDFLGMRPDPQALKSVIQIPHSYVPKPNTLQIAAESRKALSTCNVSNLPTHCPCQPEKPFDDYKPSGKVVLFCIVKDEITRLPWFLEYYRRLGCSDFVFIDTGSKDGTIDYLKLQSDVFLYHAPASQLTASRWGTKWVNTLGLIHAKYRWALLADIDELLTWPDQEVTGLEGLVFRAERLGLNRVFTPMIDIYPDKPCDTLEDYKSSEPYDKVCRLMDSVEHTKAFWSKGRLILQSGPRMRHLTNGKKIAPFMTKQNLYYVEPGGFEHIGSHFDTYALPSPLVAPLLHFKFLPDFEERMKKSIAEGFHWNDAAEYKNYAAAQLSARHLSFKGSVDFRSDQGIVKYINSMSQFIRKSGLCGSVHWKKFTQTADGDVHIVQETGLK